jgi:hypothetical protein
MARPHVRFALPLIVLLAVPLLISATSVTDDTDSRLSSGGRLAKQRLDQLPKQRLDKLAKGLSSQGGGCVNEPDCDDETPLVASMLQAETSIAVDATGQHVVIAFNDFRGFSKSPLSISGFAYSDDGGTTFVDGGQLPSPGTDVISGELFPQIFGDPDVKYVGACTFVYSSLGLEKFGTAGIAQTVVFHRSTDCGHTWQGPFDIPPSINPNGLVDINGDAVDAADKELTDIDPDTGRYGVCWSNFTPAAPLGVEISCTFSDNITSATPTFAPRRVIAAGATDGQGASLRFAGNGSPLAVIAWTRFTGAYTNNIGLALSTDNGFTWSAPRNLASNFVTTDQVLGNDRVNTNPSVAIDNSPGLFRNYIYVVYSNNNSIDGADVVLQRSSDGGITFSAPVLLNSRPGKDRAQWFPFVTVDRTTGRAHVFYYDQGIDTSGDLTEVTYTYSDDGGVTWSRPVPISDRPFKAGLGNDTSQPNLGDYNQAVAQFATLYASYAATRPVGFTDGQPATSMTTPDVQAKVVSATPKAALRLGASTFIDSGSNGNIDPGERVTLQLPLTNYVTNPLSASSTTNINATLSSATAGVTILQGASAYSNLPPGATGVNFTAYQFQVSPSFVAGTPIEFSLDVSTADGPTTLPFTLFTGTPVYTQLLAQDFNSVAPGALPAGWVASHGAGPNTVPWTTSSTFAAALCGSSNKAFHREANDVPGNSDQARWERLFSPTITVPAVSDYVTVDFDVCYDTEDDPVLPTLAYDGFFLRVTDVTPGRTLRSVLAEAFERQFTTDGFKHYPKHFPRNDDPSYFEDMSAWAGYSNGLQHVHLELPGMAGSQFQLRFEYAQDQAAICSDVRPGHECGVAVDNIVVRNVVATTQLSVNLSVTASLARDASTNEILATITVSNTGSAVAQNVSATSATLGSAPTLTPLPVLGDIAPGALATAVLRFAASTGTSGSPSILRFNATYVGGSIAASFRVVLP